MKHTAVLSTSEFCYMASSFKLYSKALIPSSHRCIDNVTFCIFNVSTLTAIGPSYTVKMGAVGLSEMLVIISTITWHINSEDQHLNRFSY